MEVEIKTIKLTKSKILQMDYIGVPKNPLAEVLGWINIDKQRYAIVKVNGNYYRGDFVTKIEKEQKGVQFALTDGGYEFPVLTNVRYSTFNSGLRGFVADRDEAKNIQLYEHLTAYKRKTEIAGQVYY